MDGGTPERRNSLDGGRLRSFVERVERLTEEKREVGDAIGAVMAEAKADGYTPRYIKAVVKLRAQKPSEREEDEAMMDLYLAAMGMANETPLFRYANAAAGDSGAQDKLVEALLLLAPNNGEIVVKVGAAPRMRLWRDDKGAHAEQVPDQPPPAPPGSGPAPGFSPRSAPKAPPPDLPPVDEEGARELGRQARREDVPVVRNPFPWDDKRRGAWDAGWREQDGGDGMGPP